MATNAAEGIAKMGMVDLINRDPNDLNDHVKVLNIVISLCEQ